MPIATGDYRIRNVQAGTYFDASRQSDKVHGWSARPQQDNQKWHVETLDGGFVLRNAENGKYARVSNNNDGTKVTYGDNPTFWDIVHVDGRDSKSHRISVRGTGQSIDLDWGKSDDGTGISIWGFQGKDWQIWDFERVGGGGGNYNQGGNQQQSHHSNQGQYNQGNNNQGGYNNQGGNNQGYNQGGFQPSNQFGDLRPGIYILRNVKSQTVADLSGGRSDEAPIIGYSYHGGDNQKWDVQATPQGYTLRNIHTGTYLAHGWNDSPNQGTDVKGSNRPTHFVIQGDGDGHQIILCGTNLVVDLARGDRDDGTKVVYWNNGHGQNQKWRFEQA